MFFLACLALSYLRLHIVPSIAYTASTRNPWALLHGSALPRLSPSTIQHQTKPETFSTARSNIFGTLVPVLRHSGVEPQQYTAMTAKGVKKLNAESKVGAAEDEAATSAGGTKRKLEGAIVKPEEKETKDPLPSAESQSSNVAATGEASAAGEEEEETEESGPPKDSPVTKKRRAAPKARAKASSAKKNASGTAAPPSGTLKPDEEFTALAELAAKSRKFVGAHISAAGGVHNSLVSCFNVKDKTKQENAYNALLDDLQRCETLGIKLYNIHPGSTVGDCSKEEGIRNIAAAVNRAHKDTKFVVVVLENMAGQKNVVGSKFEDLRDIIDLIEDKDRVGVCLDTCHLFAAGYDIRTAEKFEKVMEEFDAIVGYKYLKGMHLNDSKSELSSGLDRHELLGKGHLGLEPFKYIMRHPSRFKDMPLILETPDPTEGSIWKKEIKQMYSFLSEKEEL